MKAKVQRWLTAGMAALGAVFMTHSASAAVPWTITHQGRLYNAMGAPVTKTLDVVFTIYADEGGTTELWKEARSISFEEGRAVRAGAAVKTVRLPRWQSSPPSRDNLWRNKGFYQKSRRK